MTQVKVLVVEDEAISAENIAIRLQKQGYAVVGIVDAGDVAIETAKRTSPDIILMDIMLKGEVDGIRAASEIYTQLKVPIVYMTAFADRDTLERSKQAQPFGYLVKPFKPQELRATIEIALHKKSLEAEADREMENAQKLRQHAEAISKLNSEFVAMIAHEFRTPISTISLSTELLEKRGDKLSGEKREKRFKHIHESISSMTKLLDDVQLLSLDRNGSPSVNYSNIDLNIFCEDLLEEIQFVAQETHSLRFSGLKESTTASIDIKILRHVLINLLSNAIKYSPIGSEVSLSVSTIQKGSDRQEWLKFGVEDHGIGIPVHEQAQLFSSFFRASNVGTIPGTGLGLAIAKKFVRLHGGQIYCQSEAGQGTLFTIELPTEPIAQNH
ncbi:response regulator receiver sensor signal transduction histidine kinase [Thalassoporum mexicanum PCC 7367]|uniref:hybrid sensor histidine kinase/response regulator n=1 Tax=Thalassoporum mexicanum TaxID=3457544 RepID=UPI00029F91CB|nr:ATP-binding protein [Pseudanabaena sp. PCC 7367]AFY68790.1 response regulator receiver sensor signal transduction histidine kinase [Pseudanabaena sp. PCC 7367]